jgi:hypothetical protein
MDDPNNFKSLLRNISVLKDIAFLEESREQEEIISEL